jgi:glycosyltransferase involved in cell wall biosynthesis
MDKLKIALLGPYPAQECLNSSQIKSSRRGHQPHPAPWIKSLCEGLSARKDVEAGLFVHSRDVSSVQRGKVGEAGCWFVPKIEPGNLDPVFGDWTARIQMRPLIDDFNPDVVLGFGTESMYGLLASAFDRPAVIYIQGIVEKLPLEAYGIPRWKHKFLKRMERRAIRRADAVIAENNFSADWAKSVNPRIKTAVITHPVTPEFLQIHPDYSKRIIFVGAVNSNKRPDRVARAFASICSKHPDAELVIVGESGDVKASLQEFIAGQHLSTQIKLLGPLKRDEVMREMSRARCLALASKMDTSPNVITEAHAAGLPVVATRVGGIPEMVEENKDGFLVDVNDETAMADRLDRLLADQSLAMKMGEAGRKKILGMNVSDDIAGRYVDFFRDLISLRHT